MRVLIIDSSTETQAFCAKRVEGFNKSDKEMLDLKVKLVSPTDFLDRLSEADVVLLGAGIAEDAVTIARKVKQEAPWIQMVMFVGDTEYGGGAFRAASAAGVRKVFPDSATSLDLLQELVAIHSDFQKEGRTFDGKVIVVMHAKGGVGATSIAAGLGEVCSTLSRRTLLWDLDVETKDLSRALTAAGPEAKLVSGWVNGSREITRENLRDALIPLASDVSILIPPDKFAESMDLVCHADGMEIAQRIVELAKVLFDVVIIDTAGRMGPAVGGLLRSADTVILVSDDTELSLTATDLLLSSIKPLLAGLDQVRILLTATSEKRVSLKDVIADFQEVHELPEDAWEFPVIPFDSKIADWPGSGNTPFSSKVPSITNTFSEIVAKLGLAVKDSEDSIEKQAPEGGWLSRIFR
jgi:MinD-like ATPase involved in chromosome partitioning or flagellar assembly